MRAFFHPPRRGPASGRQPAPPLPSARRWRTPPAESFFHPRKTTVFSQEALFSLNKLRMRHRCNRPAVTCEQLARPRTSRKQPAPSPTVLCPDGAVAAWNLSSPLPSASPHPALPARQKRRARVSGLVHSTRGKFLPHFLLPMDHTASNTALHRIPNCQVRTRPSTASSFIRRKGRFLLARALSRICTTRTTTSLPFF